jgi:alkylated DNA nucleotide flippase Atl1
VTKASIAAGRERILQRVRAIPAGWVRTYGDISPGAPRLAGHVLRHSDDPQLPWHRVVRADGSLAKGARQRRLLRAEGVPFRGDRVAMDRARLDDLDAAG